MIETFSATSHFVVYEILKTANLWGESTVFPIHKLANHIYAAAIILVIGAQAIGISQVEHSDKSHRKDRIGSSDYAHGEHSIGRHGGSDHEVDHSAFAAYSYSSPAFRHSLKQLAANTNVPPDAEKQITGDASKPATLPATSAIPNKALEQLQTPTKIFDPCAKVDVDVIPPPATRPNALEPVKDRDPALHEQIKAKVTDPRYTGELGNITESTHDKKGRVNGCKFIQNVPYWESGAAAQSFVDVNLEIAKHGKKLEADPLNGAGRTIGQEEAIVWRNSGAHAKVGKSNHGFGRAMDYKDDPNAKAQTYDDPFVNHTLHAHGWRQGDSRGPIKNDLHHWSFVGPGPAQDGTPPHKAKHGHHR
ncbi:MAG: hypothetical protein EKK48_08175 [Candidatus Melainabacteria bacterium]|nr:MAG: hypothetical protein EKK48_08175 [Candidatus Melainabacteria bacterium]